MTTGVVQFFLVLYDFVVNTHNVKLQNTSMPPISLSLLETQLFLCNITQAGLFIITLFFIHFILSMAQTLYYFLPVCLQYQYICQSSTLPVQVYVALHCIALNMLYRPGLLAWWNRCIICRFARDCPSSNCGKNNLTQCCRHSTSFTDGLLL